MMTIPDLLKAKNLALKSTKLKVDVIRLKQQVEEAFNSELTFDVSLKEISPEKSSNDSKIECKPIIDRGRDVFGNEAPEHAFDGIYAAMRNIMKSNVDEYKASSLPTIRVDGSEAALLIGYLYELKVRELEKVNEELRQLGIEIP